MTTIQERSFAGFVVAHAAVMLVVCGGLVLLLPTPVLAQGPPATISAIPVDDCDASADPAGDHQMTRGDGELSAPDSDDDDDDHDAPSGSDAAISVDTAQAISHGDAIHLVHVEADPWVSRTADRHSLRGPPADDQTSSDADDIDGDDDDPSAEYSIPVPPTTSCELGLLTFADFVTVTSTRSSVLSLRAPPA